MSARYVEFPNLGILEVTLSDDELAPIWKEVNKIQKDFSSGIEYNHKLAGNLAKEYRLFDSAEYINGLVFHYLKEYDNITGHVSKADFLTGNLPLVIPEPWVNFQAKHEFNPPHIHSGIASFVIWLSIPYQIDQELSSPSSARSHEPLAGFFTFQYTNTLGQIRPYNIPADKTMENKMLIFPAELTHSVHPFYTSDKYRISVSGNVKFLNPQDK
jgi:hypothetical protein